MPKELFNKEEIAITQLDTACKLFLEGHFISAASLGGCAESLTEGLVRKRNIDPTKWKTGFIKSLCEKRKKQTPPNQAILKEVNRVRNLLKHHDNDDPIKISFNAKLSAFLIISETIENILTLGYEQSELMNEFIKHTKNYDGV